MTNGNFYHLKSAEKNFWKKEDSISLQKKRNALLHGRIELKIIVNFDPQLGMEEKLYIHATLYRKGVSEVFEFDLDEIEQLYYDIAHLHGRINEASDLNANIEGLPLEHKLSLTGFLKNNHPEYNDKL